MNKRWQDEVCKSAAADAAAMPEWEGVTPHCSERCSYHDGKRCELMGFRPSRLCEPVVREMGVKLSGGYG